MSPLPSCLRGLLFLLSVLYIYINIYIYIHICVHIYIYVSSQVISVYVSIYLNICTCIYIYKYKYIYICIYVFKIYIFFHCIHNTYLIKVNSAGTISSRFDKAAEDNEAGKESVRDLPTVVLVIRILR